MEKICFKTKKGPAAVGPYSTATIYGGVIYMSGMIGVNPQTGKAPEGGTLAQAAQAFENIKTVLGELGAGDRPILEVLNKADAVRPGTVTEPADAILISAREGKGLETLKTAIAKRVSSMRHRTELVVPYDKGAVLSLIHSQGKVLSEEYLENGTKVDCMMDTALYQRVLSQLQN